MKTYLNLHIFGVLFGMLTILQGCAAGTGQAVAQGLQQYSHQMQQYQPPRQQYCYTNYVGNMAFRNCY